MSKCKKCGSELSEERKPYEVDGLLLQTPKSVWEEYKANGYTIAEALSEERSYA